MEARQRLRELKTLGATFFQVIVSWATILLAATAANAATHPGPPPWRCTAVAECPENAPCVLLNEPSRSFILSKLQNNRSEFLVENPSGGKETAKFFYSIEEAKEFVETDRNVEEYPIILLPIDTVFDGIGFISQTINLDASGERVISGLRTVITCGGGPLY
ncbi:hypothetical protein [Roseibium sp. MMSF_3544]|uniref:hypothetical protein n=1 Tax=unclassified Roseibium TaxID=2629323 RepID=UPI00273FFB0B|nr:hypothetical protein [Roseibium sp. MMSF_3544]